MKKTSEKDLLSKLPFVEVDPKTQPCFCVDGRRGERETKGPYPQTLGGSFHFVVLKWILEGGRFDDVYRETFQQLKTLGYPLGVHRDDHAIGEAAGCGFADNIRKIIETLIEKSGEVWEILNQVVDLKDQERVWQEIIRTVNQKNLDEIPSGDRIIQTGENLGAEVQVLTGDHQEQAAVVNLVEKTTLDVDNNQDHQAFNLDLWYVLQVAEDLEIEEQQAKLLSLGLYVATEMVLVENKGKDRLPILVRND